MDLMKHSAVHITVCVINYGTGDLVERFLKSLRTSQANLRDPVRVRIKEVLVIDSGFPELADADRFVDPAEYPWPVRIIPNLRHSYSSGVNRALEEARTEWVFVSNSDVEVVDYRQLEIMVLRASESEKVAAMCPQLLYPGGEWQRSYGNVPGILEALKFVLGWDKLGPLIMRTCYRRWSKRNKRLPDRLKPVGYPDGAFLLLSKSIFQRLGGFDEAFRFYAEETDYAERAKRAGYRVCYLGVTPVIHVRGGTVDRLNKRFEYAQQFWRAVLQFVRKHRSPTYLYVYRKLILLGYLWRQILCHLIFRCTGNDIWHSRADTSRRLRAFLRDRVSSD